MKKRTFRLPPTCALAFMIMMFCAVLTWLVPAGAFDVEKVGRMTKVIPGTYHLIDPNPVGPVDLLRLLMKGFQSVAQLIFMAFFCGAGVEALERSEAVTIAFGKLGARNINPYRIALGVMIFMTIGGATGVFANQLVAFAPLAMILARSIGFDNFSAVIIIITASYAGFNVGWANTFTIGIAQAIAELPLYSGFMVRVVLHILNFGIVLFFGYRYIKGVKKDYTTSLSYREGMKESDVLGMPEEKLQFAASKDLTMRHVLSLASLMVTVAAIVVGSIFYNWRYDEIAISFFLMTLFCGFVNKMGIDGTTKAFLDGCAKMLIPAMIIGFSAGIGVVLKEGKILNTIVYWLSIPMSYFKPILSANFMFIANSLINFVIPSGSGQATAVMPLMVPVADLAGVTRQVAVLAYQFGDGFTNCIVPTSGTILGTLAIVGVEYGPYLKWYSKILACEFVLAVVALTFLQYIGWTGL